MLAPARAAALATSAFVRPAVPPALLTPPLAEALAWATSSTTHAADEPGAGDDDRTAAAPSDAAPENTAPEDASPYRTVVDTPRSSDALDAQRRLDARSPGFATAVDLEHEPGTRPADGLPEVIARTPGASVRSFGGLGQFGSVSLRGSSAQQVAIFLDGVPVNDSVAGLVDLSQLPLDGLARVEIYRGHVPVEFGSAAIGGAIDLVGAPAWQRGALVIHGGYGSFGARESRLSLRGPLGRRGRSAGAISLGYAGATGDFLFVDDGGTPDIGGDDRSRRRTNNDYDRLALSARLDHRRGRWRVSVQQLAQLRERGVPGTASAQSRQARVGTVTSRTIARVLGYGLGGPGGRIEWLAGVGLGRQVFVDPAGEVGLARDDRRLLSADLYLSPRLRLPLWRDAYLGLVADQRVELVDTDQRAPTVGSSGDSRRSRLSWGAGVQLEQFLVHDRWRLVPVFRVDGLDSRFSVPAGAGEQDDGGRDHATVGTSPRLGTTVRLWPGVQLRTSGGRYFRPPNLTELFGNQGYFEGNEGLRPERGWSVDGGVVLDREWMGLTTYAQLAGFATWSEDLIYWVPAGTHIRVENLAGARVRGLETSLALVPARRWLTLHANYTLLDSRNDAADPEQQGRPLRGRPRHELFARATAGRSLWVKGIRVEPRVLYTIDVIAQMWLDPSGRYRPPAWMLQGIGGEVTLDRRVHLAVEVRNLLDVRTTIITAPLPNALPHTVPLSDFIGYPLPGRSVWGSVRIELGGRRR